MSTAGVLVTLEEYLNTAYEPDMDFVDGHLVRRNMGTQSHGRLQSIIIVFLSQFERSHRIRLFTETRLRVEAARGRHRIADIMALDTPFKRGKVVVDVPGIVVEIKSPDDTFDDIVDRCFDYEKLGVPDIVVMDPDNKRAWMFEHGDLRLLTGNSVNISLPGRPPIEFPFAKLFADLDEEE
jgi:Uma2 family endonuclease